MAECFLFGQSGGVAEAKVIPDIYNHGDVVGLNPEIFIDIDTNIFDIYELYQTIAESSSDMSFDDSALIMNYGGNQVWYLPYLINTKGYKYLCVEAESTGRNGAYNVSNFGALKKFNTYLAPSYFARYIFTDYNNSIYQFSRQTVKIDISSCDNIYLAAHNCNSTLKIYSIYLSNDEN